MARTEALLSLNLQQPEKRTTPILNWNQGWDAFATAPTSSGEYISDLRALQLATVFTAVSIIAKSIGTLPVVVSKQTDRGKIPVPEHPLQFLLGTQPNEECPSAAAFWEAFVGHLALGNGLAEIQRTAAGDPIGLWILDPRCTQPWRDESGALVYRTTQGGQLRTLVAQDVLHVPLFSQDGVWGLSPIAQCREMLGTAVAVERFGGRFFANYARPAVVLKTKSVIKPEDKVRMRADWEAMQSGNNTHRVAILDQEMELQPLSIAPDEAQFMETQRFNRETICGLFGVPLHLLGDSSKLSRASTEELNRAFYTDTLNPILARITQAIALKVLPRAPGSNSEYCVDFDVSSRLAGDETAQMNRVATLTQWGTATVNEVRKGLGFPSLGSIGDRLLTPVNMNITDTRSGQIVSPTPLTQEEVAPDN